jgi:hypothetical protein
MQKRGYSLNTQSDKELIIEYLLNGDKEASKISPKLEERLNRMRSCAEIIRQHGSSARTIPLLMKMWDIGQTEAYNIFNETQEVFGTTTVHNREFMVDVIIGNIMETRTKAMLKKDLKVVAKCDENLMYAIEKFLGDKEAIDWSKIQPPQFYFGFFPELSNVELPDDWESQVKNLVQQKRKKTLNIDNLQNESGSYEETS